MTPNEYQCGAIHLRLHCLVDDEQEVCMERNRHCIVRTRTRNGWTVTLMEVDM